MPVIPAPTDPTSGNPYQPNTADAMMFNPLAMAYPTAIRALAQLSGKLGLNFADDVFGGLNTGHAMWRAKQNWPGYPVLPNMPAGHPMQSASPANPYISQLFEELFSLPPTTYDDLMR